MTPAKQSPNPNLFSNPQSLSNWLKPRLPQHSFHQWGVTPGTKNVHNLWLELSEGETSLTDSTPPVRTVSVVTVRVIGGVDRNKVLMETYQELSDGSKRGRFRPLSEKMKPTESVECAVIRAVNEELGSIIGGLGVVRIVEGSYKKNVEERISVSYPGLPARYILHSVDALVEGLPDDEEFCTEEDEFGNCSSEVEFVEKAVFVKKHFWKWVVWLFVITNIGKFKVETRILHPKVILIADAYTCTNWALIEELMKDLHMIETVVRLEYKKTRCISLPRSELEFVRSSRMALRTRSIVVNWYLASPDGKGGLEFSFQCETLRVLLAIYAGFKGVYIRLVGDTGSGSGLVEFFLFFIKLSHFRILITKKLLLRKVLVSGGVWFALEESGKKIMLKLMSFELLRRLRMEFESL
ncbi:hypothetical protein GIB67_034601 [Kingdonia uniflora]|uniref:Nudix hydrolase domain-containing protein n=1 Tax=Kingdonia uniflora TaxID=39325 RepID=A0A7J7MXG4_9MAGN|nr:hypothetical protein GIB67_034601 [Kingdonia uniflora]